MRSFSTVLLLLSILSAGGVAFTGCSSATKKHTHYVPLLPGMEKPGADVSSGSDADHVQATKDSNQTVVKDAADETIDDAADGDILKVEKPTAKDESEAADAVADADKPGDSDEPELDEEPTSGPRKHQIPFEFNQRVAGWIEYFSQKDRDRFQRFLDRGEPYREAVENILEENGVPIDLYYLGLIESGFSIGAKSSARAVGVWQFMRPTGRLYGLTVDAYVDERKDPIRATEAAAKMMRDLHNEFHSWYLAMAAYNAGLGRIRRAVKRGHTNDFWELVEKKVLPKETMDYVPKFLAARYIGENPDVFAFYLNEEKKYPDVELVHVPSPITFESIEKTCSMPLGTLAFVNPQYSHEYTHPGHKEDSIWVPTNYQKSVEENFQKLAQLRIHVKPVKEVREPPRRLAIYRVKKGDSLKTISRKTGLSVAYLKRVNGLRSSRVMPGQTLRTSAASYHQKKAHPRRRRRKRH
jgi:membrane-bound lytic murein transglycosylase D